MSALDNYKCTARGQGIIRTARGQGIIRLPNKHLLLLKVPVVQNHPHGDDVRRGQWIGEEVATDSRYPVGQARLLNFACGYRQSAAAIMSMRAAEIKSGLRRELCKFCNRLSELLWLALPSVA